MFLWALESYVVLSYVQIQNACADHWLRMDSQRRQEFSAMALEDAQEFADECARRQMNALGVEVCECMIFLVCMFLYGVPIGLYVLMGSSSV